MTSPPAPPALLLVGPPGEERLELARDLRSRGLEVIQLDEDALVPFLDAVASFPGSVPRPVGAVLCPGVRARPPADLPCLRGIREGGVVRWAGPDDLLALAPR